MSKRLLVAFAVAAIAVSVAAQAPAPPKPAAKATPAKAGWTPSKTPWGDPDLRGTWTSDNALGVLFERPAQFGDRALMTDEEFAAREKANATQVAKDLGERPESRFEEDDAPNNSPRHWLERGFKPSRQTSLVIDPPNGRIPPMTPEGQRRVAERQAARSVRGPADGPEDRSNYDRCISRGITSSILPAIYGNGTRILQGPGFVVIQNEMIHESRLVPLDGRPHVGKTIRTYMGDPRGHFEGSTLVVETTNFSSKTAVGGFGTIPSPSMTLTERFTRTAADTIRYEFTVDDPGTYMRPWTAGLDLNTKPGYEIYEYACHEGNYGMRNMLSAARADDRAAAEAAPKK
jgi:hypothetical protein